MSPKKNGFSFNHIQFGSWLHASEKDNPLVPCRFQLNEGFIYLGSVGNAETERLSAVVDDLLLHMLCEAQELNTNLEIIHFDRSPGIELVGAFTLTGSNAYRIEDSLDFRDVIKSIENLVRERNLQTASAQTSNSPLVCLVDADSFGLETSEMKILEAALNRDLSRFSLSANVLVIAYGRKQNSISKTVTEIVRPDIGLLNLKWSDMWVLDGGTYDFPHISLLKDLGFKWNGTEALTQTERLQKWKRVAEWHEVSASKADQDFVSIPVGTSDSGDGVRFKLGDTSEIHHAFIVGTNGTGKTSFLNQIILGIAERYDPSEIELYLADLKQGVEFQFFDTHPNCRAIFLGEDRLDDLLLLLKSFAEKIEDRARLFKKYRVNKIRDFNDLNVETKLPRLLLIVDEVHQLFGTGWKQAGEFQGVLEKVVRQGRSYGIHVILSTQTLTGANVSKAIMSQIPLRIAFKLIASETYQIFATNNDAPTRLPKYHFVYNTEAGLKEANVVAKAMPPREIAQVLLEAKARHPDRGFLTPEIITGSTSELQNEQGLDDARAAQVIKRSNWDSGELKL